MKINPVTQVVWYVCVYSSFLFTRVEHLYHNQKPEMVEKLCAKEKRASFLRALAKWKSPEGLSLGQSFYERANERTTGHVPKACLETHRHTPRKWDKHAGFCPIPLSIISIMEGVVLGLCMVD